MRTTITFGPDVLALGPQPAAAAPAQQGPVATLLTFDRDFERFAGLRMRRLG